MAYDANLNIAENTHRLTSRDDGPAKRCECKEPKPKMMGNGLCEKCFGVRW